MLQFSITDLKVQKPMKIELSMENLEGNKNLMKKVCVNK